MQVRTSSAPLPGLRSGCIVAGVYEGPVPDPAAAALDAATGQAISRLLARGDLDGRAGGTLLLHDPPGLACERVLLVGLGPRGDLAPGRYRAALACALAALQRTGAAEATLCLPALPVAGRDTAWALEQAVLAVHEAAYRFDRLKSQRPPLPALASVTLHLDGHPHPAGGSGGEAAAAQHVPPPDDTGMADRLRRALERGAAIAEGVALARDLGNLPGNLCTPDFLAGQARALAARHGLAVEVLDEAAMRALGMEALLAVARGSRQPPRLIVLRHDGGAPGEAPVVLVGKGITFDSGGLSLKAAPAMEEMKFDMCGAASVMGALQAAALMHLPLNVVGIVAAAENMPDGNATRPGDVVGTLAGLTVEILDTDSEGRLVLCDALAYARRFRPAVLIDVATLTGEIVKALGEVACGLFASSEALAQEVVAAGERAWDRAWPMPLWEEYEAPLHSNFADLPNIGSDADCAVTAACFLWRFTRGCPWVHLDVAGTASRGGDQKGATGRPVPLLAHFLAGRAGRL